MKKITVVFTLIFTILLLNNQLFAQNSYFEFGGLNHSSTDVGSTWTKLNTGDPHTFTKNQSDTDVEVYLNSWFFIGFLNANGARFMVRIDDAIDPDYDNEVSIKTSNTSEFMSIFAVFKNLPAGSHTVSIWAKAAPSGDVEDILVDQGGWGGRIIVKIINETTVAVPENTVVPEEDIVKQNFPNPFYPETTIDYTVQYPAHVELKIYNSSGQWIKTLVDEYKTIGEYSVVWNSKNNSGKAVSPGNYFYQIRVGEFVSTKKMIIFRK